MKEDLLKIINHYGVMPQLKYFQSEVFELNEAIISTENDEFNYYDEVEKSNKKHIAEEIADCLVMLNQFVEYYKIQESDIYMIMEQKIDRQLGRIEIIEKEKEIEKINYYPKNKTEFQVDYKEDGEIKHFCLNKKQRYFADKINEIIERINKERGE